MKGPLAKASLDTVTRKLGRAEKHLDSLKADLDVFDHSRTVSISTEIDTGDGAELWRLHILREPDPEWEITVGEIAYQIRSALDHLVTQLVILNGGDPDKHRSEFPIFVDRKRYFDEPVDRLGNKQKSRRDTLLFGVAPEPRLVIDSVQPFRHGSAFDINNDPLAILEDVCNWDKHRYGHPTAFVLRSILFFQESEFGVEPRRIVRQYGTPAEGYPTEGREIEDGGVIVRAGGKNPDPDLLLGTPIVQAGFVVGVRFGRRRIFIGAFDRMLKLVRDELIAPLGPFFQPVTRDH